MTDRERIIEMLTRAKIEYTEKDYELSVERGYVGFASTFTFNEDGSLKNLEAYE